MIYAHLSQKIVLLTLICSQAAYGIIVHNTTQAPIYAATYIAPHNTNQSSTRISEIKEIAQGGSQNFDRPSLNILQLPFNDRLLLFSHNPADLASSLSHTQTQNLPHTGIGVLRGEIFYIAARDGILQGYTFIEFHLISPLVNLFDSIDDAVLLPLQTIWQQTNPHKNDVAYTTTSSALSQGEVDFIAQRTPAIQHALAHRLGCCETKKIAIACSGGGVRAEMYTLGALKALEESGILQASSYISALSGSTWALHPLIASGKPLNTFCEEAIGRAQISMLQPSFDVPLFNALVLKKVAFEQQVSVIDIFGMQLYNRLYKGWANPQLGIDTKNINYPYPIYTCNVTETLPYSWIEITPDLTGSQDLKAYTPTWALGRRFENGISQDFDPANAACFFLACASSSISLNLRELTQIVLSASYGNTTAYQILSHIVENTEIGQIRPIAAKIPNFAYGVNGSPVSNQSELNLVDAGIKCNLPLAPLVRPERGIQIIIVLDASGRVWEAPELMLAVEELKQKGYKLPHIDYIAAGAVPFSVWNDPQDPSVPTIIYLPRVYLERALDPQYETGFDVTYNEQQSRAVMNSGYQTVKDALPTIINAIKQHGQ